MFINAGVTVMHREYRVTEFVRVEAFGAGQPADCPDESIGQNDITFSRVLVACPEFLAFWLFKRKWDRPYSNWKFPN